MTEKRIKQLIDKLEEESGKDSGDFGGRDIWLDYCDKNDLDTEKLRELLIPEEGGTMTEKDRDRAEDQARLKLEGIIELMDALEEAEKTDKPVEYEGEEFNRDDLEERIHEDPLSIEVRSGWHAPGSDGENSEYNILLCTGGPAVRILGDLNEHAEPETVQIQFQDWGTFWTGYYLEDGEEEVLLRYAQMFYYREE